MKKPRREPSLAMQTKLAAQTLLKGRYPQEDARFRLKCHSWGDVVISWTDGPAQEQMATLLYEHKDRIDLQRRYTPRFLETVARRYCRALQVPLPPISLREEDGTAYLGHHYPDITVEWGIYKAPRTLSGEQAERVAFVRREDGTLLQTAYTLKKDYSQGRYPAYAVIGEQGYGLVSGPHVRWDLYPLDDVRECRKGTHFVWISAYTGLGYSFRSVADANAALAQLATTGAVRLFPDGRGGFTFTLPS